MLARPRRRRRTVNEFAACPIEPVSLRQLDCDRIAGRLWQGGLHGLSGCRIKLQNVDVVVVLAPDAQVDIASPKPVVIPLRDETSDLDHVDLLHGVAARLARAVRRGRRVLVLCHQGLNRSGLVTGLTLWHLGYSGQDAVRLIRGRRRGGLSRSIGAGQEFADYLRSLS